MHLSRMPSFEELLKPPPAYYPKNIYYKFYSLFLRTIGMFSEGMRIGFTHGFDSGMIMNYVCQNTPSGRFYIGKVLDRNLLNKVSYEQGNALDIESLKRIYPKPNLVIEVGLYGIIHDDELLRRHFFELKDILNPGAILFNVQTYNPQIELIARVLKNRDGERCVWHLRPVELVIEWAEKAGFIEPQVTMDPYGIYAVVMMRN